MARHNSSATGRPVDSQLRGDVLDLAAAHFVKPAWSTIVRYIDAVGAVSLAVDTGDRTAGRQVQADPVVALFKQVCHAAVEIQKPVGEELFAAVAVGIQEIDLFPAVAVDVTGRYADCLPLGIAEQAACQIARHHIREARASEFKGEVRIAEAGDNEFRNIVPVEIGHGDTIAEARSVALDQMAVVDKEIGAGRGCGH